MNGGLRFPIVSVLTVLFVGNGPCAAAQTATAPNTNQTAPVSIEEPASALVLQRLAHLEQRADSQQVKALEERFNDAYRVFSIAGGLLALLGIWSFLVQRRDYKNEREFYQQRALKFEERQKLSLEHALKVSTEAAERESKFAKQQLKLGEDVLARSGQMLEQQIGNISKLGDVLRLVKETFAQQQESATTSTKANEKVQELSKAFQKQYAHAVKHLNSLSDVKAMDWPKLLEEDKSAARRARSLLEGVMNFVSAEQEQKDPYELAKVWHLMGVTALYDNEIDSALEHLEEAARLYAKHPARPEDIMRRAYTKHFLGICEKNWRIVGAPPESNLAVAEKYLAEACEVLKGDSKQFLIPVTLAEVKSYKSGNRAEASKLLNGLISKLQQLSRVNQIDSNQKALLVRALLLKGNLHFYAKQHSEAAKCYNTAADVDPKNPFPHLSWAQLGGSHDPTVIASRWKEGLTLLEDPKSGALQKREITTKVTACAWAVITTRALNDAQRASHYAQELETIGKSIRPIANRIPLFFSPISKIPLSFEDLSEELP